MDEPDAPTQSSSVTPPLRLFLVEDSALLRELLIDSFSLISGITIAGYADSEDEALAQLHASPCDIVIVDIQLRQGNGIALLRKLVDQPDVPMPICIVLSNNVGTAYRRSIAQVELCFFFDKTTEFSQLHQLLVNLGAGVDAQTLL